MAPAPGALGPREPMQELDEVVSEPSSSSRDKAISDRLLGAGCGTPVLHLRSSGGSVASSYDGRDLVGDSVSAASTASQADARERLAVELRCLTEEFRELRGSLLGGEGPDGGAGTPGGEELVRAMREEVQQLLKLQRDAAALVRRDPALGPDVQSMLDDMKTIFNQSFSMMLDTRAALADSQRVTLGLGRALRKGRRRRIHHRLDKLGFLSSQMSSRSEWMERELEALHERLAETCMRHQDESELHQGQARATGVGAVMSGAAGLAAYSPIGEAALTGVMGATGAGGSAAAGSSLLAALPALGPLGVAALGLLAAGGALATASALLRQKAHADGNAQEFVGGLQNIANLARRSSITTKRLWKGISDQVQATACAFDDMASMGAEDTRQLSDATLEAAKHQMALVQCVDEYLVYVAESRLYPVNGAVTSAIGRRQYKAIKERVQITIPSSPVL